MEQDMQEMKFNMKLDDPEWETFAKWIKDMLHVGPVKVTFTKKDGTERIMNCTLQPEALPKVEVKEDKEPRKKNTDSIAVFDLDNQAWRSFIIKNVKSVSFDL